MEFYLDVYKVYSPKKSSVNKFYEMISEYDEQEEFIDCEDYIRKACIECDCVASVIISNDECSSYSCAFDNKGNEIESPYCGNIDITEMLGVDSLYELVYDSCFFEDDDIEQFEKFLDEFGYDFDEINEDINESNEIYDEFERHRHRDVYAQYTNKYVFDESYVPLGPSNDTVRVVLVEIDYGCNELLYSVSAEYNGKTGDVVDVSYAKSIKTGTIIEEPHYMLKSDLEFPVTKLRPIFEDATDETEIVNVVLVDVGLRKHLTYSTNGRNVRINEKLTVPLGNEILEGTAVTSSYDIQLKNLDFNPRQLKSIQ